MISISRMTKNLLLLLFTLAIAGGQLRAQAYCTVTELKTSSLSNGVQILLKADGLLNWNWEASSRAAGWGQEMTSVAIRFSGARIGVEKKLYDVDQDPVSTAALIVPQDSQNGLDFILQVNMTQSAKVEASLSEDRQTFLLTVKGKRTVDRANRDPGSTAALKEGAVEVTAQDGLISIHAVKANIHQVVAEIARQGGIDAAVDDAVRRDISMNLLDRKPADVLRGIAAGYGLALSTVGNLYMLSEGVPTDISTYQRSDTSSFAMRYLKAGDAKSLLPSFLFKYVHENPEQNAVVVTAPSQMLAKIGRDLATVDVPPPMILVECAVIELTDSADFDASFRWRYQDNEHDFGTDSTTGDVSYRDLDIDKGLASAIVPTPQLQVWLKRLLTNGRAKVEAHPSMAAVNGKSAEIFIGSQRFIKVQTIQNGPDAGAVRNSAGRGALEYSSVNRGQR